MLNGCKGHITWNDCGYEIMLYTCIYTSVVWYNLESHISIHKSSCCYSCATVIPNNNNNICYLIHEGIFMVSKNMCYS